MRQGRGSSVLKSQYRGSKCKSIRSDFHRLIKKIKDQCQLIQCFCYTVKSLWYFPTTATVCKDPDRCASADAHPPLPYLPFLLFPNVRLEVPNH